ncbi:probable long-chain-alcohol O-fatty-acyltransferase 1 [Magnolia sinica]|uniref:probable long-chain-alcohol O-fatty-acyltransferase 1 n=1 Tax=Magnolia sinica TaxID=86752 RepID=UPI0026584109|nr:probable long-chain-alcohol O-fatty-acyltransferase 1 [Magnolia sinica]
MEEEIKSLIKVWISVLISLSYCYLIVTKIPKGPTRLLSLLPIFYLFITLPWSFSSIHFRVISAFFLTWLGIFKLLLFSFNMGPLPPLQNSYLIFITTASLPIKPKEDPSPQNPPGGPHTPHFLKRWPTITAIRGLLLAALIQVYTYKEHFNHYVLLAIYCIHLYLSLELVLAIGAATAGAMGLEIERQFEAPYLSSSLQDFWGRRWNLMVTSILRPTVYLPVRSMCTRTVGPRWATPVAVVATFVVSGLMHELMFYYITEVGPTWEVTWFFVLHGACTAAEVGVRRALTDRCPFLPRAVYGALALGFVAVTGFWLFFPQLVRYGTDAAAIGEYAILAGFLEEKGRDLASWLGLVSGMRWGA